MELLYNSHMSKAEILDVVDENDTVIGQKTRAECHSNPSLIHRVVHCWLLNSDGQLLWQQRSMLKKLAPGMWDMSCGGHIPAGETPEHGLIRELDEELGVKNPKIHLVEKYISKLPKQTEMIHLYFVHCDMLESEFTLQKEEVQQVKWFDYHIALENYTNNQVQATDFVISQLSRIYQFLTKKQLANKSSNL